MISWRGLVALQPKFAEFEADARSFASFGCAWYPSWIRGFPALRLAVQDVAVRHGLDFDQALDVALVALQDTFRTERYKMERRARIAARFAARPVALVETSGTGRKNSGPTGT
jgi:hypothetical protein